MSVELHDTFGKCSCSSLHVNIDAAVIEKMLDELAKLDFTIAFCEADWFCFRFCPRTCQFRIA